MLVCQTVLNDVQPGFRTFIHLALIDPGHKYEPVEVFMSWVDQSKVDKSTETWLDSIENRLIYKHWYAGHYHTEKDIDRLALLFESIREFRE